MMLKNFEFNYRKLWCLHLVFIFFFGYLGDVRANCGTSDRVCQAQIKSLFYYVMYLDSSTLYTLRVDAVDTSADAVIQVISLSTNQGVCLRDSGYLGGEEILTIGPSGACTISSSGYYAVIVHGFGGVDSGGTGRFGYQLGTDPTWYNQHTIQINGFVWSVNINPNEKVQTSPDTFHGQVDPVVILQETSTSLAINANDDYGLLNFQSRVKNGSSSISNVRVIVGSFSSSYEGNVKLYRNDASDDEPQYPNWTTANCNVANDSDCDGLGNQLELALGSCPCEPGAANCPISNPSGTSCKYYDSNQPWLLNPRDSDGDGLPDYWEIFGRPAFIIGGVDLILPVLLSRFGVNIIHKDILLEVDYKGNKIVDATVDDMVTILCRGSADDLRNPDGNQGIALHTDGSGLTQKSGSCGSTSKDWGGSNAVTQAHDAENSMDSNRFGAFIYSAIGFSDINALKWQFVFRNEGQSDPLNRAGTVTTMAHELGHVLGLSHGGKSTYDNWRLNYNSVMNYGFFWLPLSPTNPISHIQYSKGILASLNPQSIVESHGLGPDINNPDKSFYEASIDFIFNYPVHSSGAIDWNYDGVISSSSYKAFVDAPLCEEFNDCFRSLEKHQIEKELNDIHATYRYIRLAVWDPNGSNPELYVFYPNTSGNLTYRKLELLYDINVGLYYDWSSGVEVKDSTSFAAIPVTSPVSATYFPIGTSQRMYVGYRDSSNKISLGYVFKNNSGILSWQNYSGSPFFWQITSHTTPDGNGANSSPEYNQGPSLIVDTRTSPPILRIFYIAKSNRVVYSRSVDSSGSLSQELSVTNLVYNNVLISGVTPSAFIHPKESSVLYLMASTTLSPSAQNKIVLLKNTNSSNLNFSEVYYPSSASVDLFSIYPNTVPVKPDNAYYLKKVSFSWQPSVVVDTVADHPARIHFLYKSEHDKPSTSNPSENLSHAISSVHKDSDTPPISWPGGYPFWFPRRSAATKAIGLSNNRHISPSLSVYSNIFEGKHVVGAYLEVEGSNVPILHYIPYLDGLHSRVVPDNNDWRVISDYMCLRLADAKKKIGGIDYPIGAGVNMCAYSTPPGGASGPGPSIASSLIKKRQKHLKKIDKASCQFGRFMRYRRKAKVKK